MRGSAAPGPGARPRDARALLAPAVLAALLAALGACPAGRGGAAGGPGGAGAGGGGRSGAPDVARVGEGGAALPPASEARPRPTLFLEAAPELEARHLVAALRRASAEGFANFRLRLAGRDAGPVFGFEIVREEKERTFTEPSAGALTAAPASAAPAAPPGAAPTAPPRTPDELAAAIGAKVPVLKGCWDALLRRRPLPEAKVSLYLRIALSGAVAEARVDASTVPDAELHACLLARVRSLAFRPAREESEVVFPLVFTASGSAEFPLAVALGARTVAVTDTRGDEHAFHAKAGDLLADDVRRVVADATRGAERAPRADLLPREGLRAGMLDLALRLLEEHARELRVVVLE